MEVLSAVHSKKQLLFRRQKEHLQIQSKLQLSVKVVKEMNKAAPWS